MSLENNLEQYSVELKDISVKLTYDHEENFANATVYRDNKVYYSLVVDEYSKLRTPYQFYQEVKEAYNKKFDDEKI